MTRSDAILQLLQLFGRLAHAQALEHEQRILDLGVGERLAQNSRGVCREERKLNANSRRFRRKLAHVVDGPRITSTEPPLLVLTSDIQNGFNCAW